MTNIRRILFGLTVTTALIAAPYAPAQAAGCSSSVQVATVQTTVLAAITAMQQAIVLALIGPNVGSPEVNILAALNAESKARTGQQNVQDQQDLANKEVDDKLEQVKLNQENVVEQGRGIADVAFEAGKKFQVTNDECVNMTNKINFEYGRDAAQESANQKAVAYSDMIANGAPGGGPAFRSKVYQEWLNARQQGGQKAAENASTLEEARTKCETPQCVNTARDNIIQRAVATSEITRPVPADVPRTAALMDYDAYHEGMTQEYAAAVETVRRLSPKFEANKTNAEMALKAYQDAFGRGGINKLKLRFPWAPKSGLNEMEARQAQADKLYAADQERKKVGANEYKAPKLAELDASLATQIVQDEKDVIEFNNALKVLRTKIKPAPAGAMPRATGS